MEPWCNKWSSPISRVQLATQTRCVSMCMAGRSRVLSMGAGTLHCSPATDRGQREWMMLQVRCSPPRLLIGPEGGASEPTDGCSSPGLILVTGYKLYFVCTGFCSSSAWAVVDYFGLVPPWSQCWLMIDFSTHPFLIIQDNSYLLWSSDHHYGFREAQERWKVSPCCLQGSPWWHTAPGDSSIWSPSPNFQSRR